MTPRKKRRLYFVLFGMAALFGATALVLTAFQGNVVFFCSPTDMQAKDYCKPSDRRLRIGGLVEEGSIEKIVGSATVRFRVTDLSNNVQVTYTGILPDLFREGQGVVAEGRFKDGVFQASEVLAKHDEKYMPPEVADALKQSGQWQGDKPK